MFYSYVIRNNGVEDILYLYMTMNYEFSSEFSLEDNVVNLKTQNFIKTNNINFKGNKVCLILDGKIIKCMYLKDLNSKRESYLSDSFMVNICLDDNSMCEISLREYLLGVLLSKYFDGLNIETLKAMTVLFNTFAFKMMSEGNYLLGTNRFAIYKPYNEYRDSITNYDGVIKKLNTAIDEVDGIYLSYGNDYILPFMHYSNNGKTLSNKNYPYLSSVSSLWDLASPYYTEIRDFKYDELSRKLNIEISNLNDISIFNDNYKKLKIGSGIFSLAEIKSILDLKSLEIYVIMNRDYLRIITKGYGIFYGLSIFGANEIANNGCGYSNILKYYFPKTKLLKKIK